MEDDLKKIMQSKTIKNKRVVAPLRVTLLLTSNHLGTQCRDAKARAEHACRAMDEQLCSPNPMPEGQAEHACRAIDEQLCSPNPIPEGQSEQPEEKDQAEQHLSPASEMQQDLAEQNDIMPTQEQELPRPPTTPPHAPPRPPASPPSTPAIKTPTLNHLPAPKPTPAQPTTHKPTKVWKELTNWKGKMTLIEVVDYGQQKTTRRRKIKKLPTLNRLPTTKPTPPQPKTQPDRNPRTTKCIKIRCSEEITTDRKETLQKLPTLNPLPTLTKPKLPTPRKQSQKIEPEIDATTPRRRFAKARRKFEENCHLPTQIPPPTLPTKPGSKPERETRPDHEKQEKQSEQDQGEHFGNIHQHLHKPIKQRAQKLKKTIIDVPKSPEFSPMKKIKLEKFETSKEGTEGGVKTLIKKWGYLKKKVNENDELFLPANCEAKFIFFKIGCTQLYTQRNQLWIIRIIRVQFLICF